MLQLTIADWQNEPKEVAIRGTSFAPREACFSSYVLAIDQGTTSTRAMLFRADTSVAAAAQRKFPQHFPADGEVEHEPEDLRATTAETCRSALRQPYNVVTRWRSVSLGLYLRNRAALRVLSA
jgi:hypothetical protein